MEALLRRLQPTVLRYLAGREPALAATVARQAWDDVVPTLAAFDGDEHALTLRLLAAARRRLALARDDAPGEDAAPPFAADVRAALDAMALLSEDQADVFLLRAVGGLSVDDVAGLTGRPPSVVRSLQESAITTLADARAKELVA